jgi:hypothetical protein
LGRSPHGPAADDSIEVRVIAADAGTRHRHVTYHMPPDVVPVAAGGRVRDDGTLPVDLHFLDTPHRLTLARRPAAGVFTPRWPCAPLRDDRLGGLRMP